VDWICCLLPAWLGREEEEVLGVNCQPARGDSLGPRTPELAFSDNPLIYRACFGVAASDRDIPGQVLSGDLVGKMKPGWEVRVCRKRAQPGQGHADGEIILEGGKFPGPRDGRRTCATTHSAYLCTFVLLNRSSCD
jgi:hypothetical protein